MGGGAEGLVGLVGPSAGTCCDELDHRARTYAVIFPLPLPPLPFAYHELMSRIASRLSRLSLSLLTYGSASGCVGLRPCANSQWQINDWNHGWLHDLCRWALKSMTGHGDGVAYYRCWFVWVAQRVLQTQYTKREIVNGVHTKEA